MKETIIGMLLMFIITFVLFSRQLFLKSITHFKLLKELYPKEFKNVNSFWRFMLPQHYYGLDGDIYFWYTVPVYYSKFKREELPKSALVYHDKLKRINKKIGVYFLLFILCFGLFWMLAELKE